MKVRNYRMAVMLKKLLFPNIAILYINNVFRFCFISLMFVMSIGQFTEKCLIVLYAVGALIQFYILCYAIQELTEAYTKLHNEELTV
ncbi:hypothetical protein E2986_12640 [Frieseomelitta varia]|uniref:Uncharacterized protein n=1 Tax=Frieseomelitta varia TaxID=561572 RepID=A0A833SD90_9HYME|nr:hypothetical protein E2986_12640 [Frieseomelitta varia]